MEQSEALSLVLMNKHRPADRRAIDAFIGSAVQRHLQIDTLFAAFIGRKMVWALLPLISQGRTVLIFGTSDAPPAPLAPSITRLLETICDHYRTQPIDLIQMLLDPPAVEMSRILTDSHFTRIAELLYLQKNFRRFFDKPFLPAGISQLNYNQQTHPLFAQAILNSYEQSLDCPALNGMRHIDDVIAGHQATGEFDPNLWFVMLENHQPLGALLLSPTHDNQTLELVYLGLGKAARGRGLGDYCLQLAGFVATQRHIPTLALAVDSINQPALNLYYRHGLGRVTSKLAMMRDLRVK